MDLLTELQRWEVFGGVTTQAQRGEAAAMPKVKPTAKGARERAQQFLSKLGISNQIHHARLRRSDLPLPNAELALRSIDREQVEQRLLALESPEALLQFLEEGVTSQTLRLDGERLFLELPGDSEGGATFELTESFRRVSLALKAREAAPVLERLNTPRLEDAPTSDGGLPTFVKLRMGPDTPLPLIKEGSAESPSGIRQRLMELVRPHQVLATGAELGEEAVLMVIGDPVRLSDGQYLPVEAMADQAKLLLQQRLKGQKLTDRVPLVRVDQTMPMPLPKAFQGPGFERTEEGEAVPSASRVELAYRLMKGLALEQAGGEPLDASTRVSLEESLGADFSHVRLHTGPVARWITDTLSARAVTTQGHVFIPQETVREASGLPSPTLVHELVHVRQDLEGRTSSRGEREAEAHAAESGISNLGALRAPDVSSLSFAAVSQMSQPTPGRSVEAGFFLAEKGTETGPAKKKPKAKKPEKKKDLLSEQMVELLKDKMHEIQEHIKEELRDRVF